MSRKCNYCYQIFDDEDRLFCPYCGEILDPELKLAVDFHRIHQEYQDTKKRDTAILKREEQAKSKPVSPPVKIIIKSTNHKTKQKKQTQKKKTTAIHNNKKKPTPKQSSAFLPVIGVIAIAAIVYILFF